MNSSELCKKCTSNLDLRSVTVNNVSHSIFLLGIVLSPLTAAEFLGDGLPCYPRASLMSKQPFEYI